MDTSDMNRVMLGCENLLKNHLPEIQKKKVGLITNQTGVDHRLRSVVDLFQENPDIDLVALYAPEHGFKGDAQAGHTVPFSQDDNTIFPSTVFMGSRLKPTPKAIWIWINGCVTSTRSKREKFQTLRRLKMWM